MTTPRGVALVRRPGPRLPEGIVTHIERIAVNGDLAARQHEAYLRALTEHGWTTVEVAPADDCPDAVFVEDTVVVCDDLAVITHPGAPSRRPEVVAVAAEVERLGRRIVHIVPPGTLDGGDVLQVGQVVYVGRSGRTNAEGIRQLRRHLSTVGRTVVAVPLRGTLHLKSAVTALPDGSVLTHGFDAGLFPAVRPVPEASGAHVVLLGDGYVLLAASAPRTAAELADLGYAPVVVDISEFEKLEGCVTCLSVLVPASPSTLTRVDPGELARPSGFSHAVVATGTVVYLAGQTALDPSGRVVGDTVVEQFEVALANLLTALRAAGGRPDQLASLTVYIVDMADYRANARAIGAVWRRLVGAGYPAMAGIAVPRLWDSQALVEVQGMAVI